MSTSNTRDQAVATGRVTPGNVDTPLITSMLVQKFTFILRDAQGVEIAQMRARSAQEAFDSYVAAHGDVPALVEEV